jgi:tetratricopeptide (TPR) repeat protein
MKHVLRILIIALAALGISVAASSAASPQGQPAGGQSAGTQPAAQQQAAQQPPLTLEEVIRLVKKNKKHLEKITPEISSRGVDFEMTPEIQQKLLDAKATPEFVAAVKNQGPSERAIMAAAAASGTNAPPEQFAAYEQTIVNELDPDRKIQAVNDFAQKYPDSPLLTYAYDFAMDAELQKGDVKGIISYGEKSLALKADNLGSLMMMVYALPLPQALENDPNPDAKLEEAEKDAGKALELIDKLTKANGETDEAFQKRKAGYLENVHAGLGMVHFQRAMGGLMGVDQQELAKAEDQYKQAVAAAPNPSPENYFRLGEVCQFEKKYADAIQAFSKVSELSQDNPALKNLADQRIAQLKSALKK